MDTIILLKYKFNIFLRSNNIILRLKAFFLVAHLCWDAEFVTIIKIETFNNHLL